MRRRPVLVWGYLPGRVAARILHRCMPYRGEWLTAHTLVALRLGVSAALPRGIR